MATITIDPRTELGPIRPMHCVNNGPVKARSDQVRGNFELYKAAKIPYMRNHDASFCSSYGGEHTVDVHLIFRDFFADENDPASYDFHLTDEYLANTLSAGTEIFYRLGSKIEHETKKYGTLPPPDFHKWARICEHIIRHYNEGWADGHRWNIGYWEIWNEPDGANDDDDPYWKKCWGGTKAQFFELFAVTAKHLKQCFPELRIGGPAVCSNDTPWGRDFLDFCAGNGVPLDFFSWHKYSPTPETVLHGAAELRDRLDSLGFRRTESICNEWNYVLNWDTRFIEGIETIISLKGAAFTAATMLQAQDLPIDILMYYDARPCAFNGLFDFYTMRPLKGYYPFVMFSELYQLGTQIALQCDDADIYAVAAQNGEDTAVMAANYRDEGCAEKALTVKGLPDGARAFILDGTRNFEPTDFFVKDGEITITLQPYSVLLIK